MRHSRQSQPGSYFLSGVFWLMGLVALATMAVMNWRLAGSLELDELLAASAVVCTLAQVPFLGVAILAWRDWTSRLAAIFAAFVLVLFGAVPAAGAFLFVVLQVAKPHLTVAPRPAHPASANTPSPGGDSQNWQERTTVMTNKGKRLALETTGEKMREAPPKPEPPAPVGMARPRWPAFELAAALGLAVPTFILALSGVLALVLELCVVCGLGFGMVRWPQRAAPQQPQAEILASALQSFALMMLAQAMFAAPARNAPQPAQAEPGTDRPSPTAPEQPKSSTDRGYAARGQRPKRPRAQIHRTEQELLHLLRTALQGGDAGIQVRSDHSLLTTNRQLGMVLGRSPGVINVALHRLAAGDQIRLTPGSRGTLIRMHSSTRNDSLPPSRTDTVAEGAQSGPSPA